MLKFTVPLLLFGIYLRHSLASDATWADSAREAVAKTEEVFRMMSDKLRSLGQQLIMLQFAEEERLRNGGSSGLKQIRVHNTGTKTYFSESHYGGSVAAIHNHANNIRTIGMGEFVAVINGVEFRTRHNDYRLVMPSTQSDDYNAVEEIPFPEVPEEVTKLPSVGDQVKEMREWFKAWRDQDYSQRDYRKYFKPVLCYLEGAWTRSSEAVDEPFSSDRHFLDAKKWFELHQRVRYASYAGLKSTGENLAFLPTKIMEINKDGTPQIAQWNYRILCHPLKNDVPLKKLQLVTEVGPMMNHKQNTQEIKFSRTARFRVDPHLDPDQLTDRKERGEVFLDRLMEQIPGKNNRGILFDSGLDDSGKDEALHLTKNEKLNVAYYHRSYRIARKDAMGLQIINRAFSDPNLYFAKTTQEKVYEMKDRENCRWNRESRKKECTQQQTRVTWSIPLEIIFLTPLSKWNPYNLEYRGEASSQQAKKVSANGRNGRCTIDDKAFDGIHSKAFYQTPKEFFSGWTVSTDAADTVRGDVCVLGKDGKGKKVRASGHYVFLPHIEGVGSLRQRYPIMPVSTEGSGTHKELDALKDLVFEKALLESFRSNQPAQLREDLQLKTSTAVSPTGESHSHTIFLSKGEVEQMKGANHMFTLFTSEANGHRHLMKIRYNSGQKKYEYVACDGFYRCKDGHDRFLIVVKDSNTK